MISGRAPFLFYSSCLVLGIGTAGLFGFSDTWVGYFLSVVFLLFGFLLISSRFLHRIGRPVGGLLLGISFAWLGAGSYASFREKALADEKLQDSPCDFVLVRLTNLPEARLNSTRAFGSIVSLKRGKTWSPVNGVGVLVSFSKKSGTAITAGDYLVVKGSVKRPQAPMNPFEFDYRNYLWNKQVVWTVFLNPSDFRVVNSDSFDQRSIRTGILELSNKADRVLRDGLENQNAYGLIKAMLLGRRDDLRTEINDAFVSSGTVHILSVSGLHVGIFFMVIRFLFTPIRKWRAGNYIYLSVLLAFLFMYAIMTGLPASVVRSALMCALVAIADVFGRRNEPVNTLLFSAYLILLFDPTAIFDIGFQLSYLAMAGVFVLYEPVSGLLSFRNKILQKAWDIVALSFAAQLLTFPLSTFYFHQFPVYFWLINPLVIDVSAVLLPLAFGLIICGWFGLSFLASVMGWWTNALALLTNWLASIPQSYLPGYLWTGLRLDTVEVAVLYLLILLFFLIYEQRSLKLLRSAFFSSLFFGMYSLAVVQINYHRTQTVVHQVRQADVVSVKYKNRMYLVGDSLWLQSPAKQGYNMGGYLVASACDTMHYYWNRNKVNSGPVRVLRGPRGDWVLTPHVVLFRGESELSATPFSDIHIVRGSKVDFEHHRKAGLKPLFVGSASMRAARYSELGSGTEGLPHAFYDIRNLGALVSDRDGAANFNDKRPVVP